ncbi:MAG TPA: hypothetical protein VMW10_04375, partial [Alphaproteobacteria bacterium]|nr:hypothetical protein [Alphaproteobacteria bacterium]
YPNVEIIAKDGEEGPPGNPGNPGEGGKNGKVYQGIYIDKSVHGNGLFWRVVGEGITGAGAGFAAGWWLGPGVIIPTGVGAVVGGLSPVVGTAADDLINGGWEQEASLITPYDEFAAKGTISSSPNSKRSEPPKRSKDIDENKIRANWKNLYNKFREYHK